MIRPYCTQQIISLVAGSMIQRSPVVCPSCSPTMQGVLCKTNNTLWFSFSLGHWGIEADWIETARETVKSKSGSLLKKIYQHNLKLSLVHWLSVLHISRLEEKKSICPRDHISSDPISFEMLTWHFVNALERVARKLNGPWTNIIWKYHHKLGYFSRFWNVIQCHKWNRASLTHWNGVSQRTDLLPLLSKHYFTWEYFNFQCEVQGQSNANFSYTGHQLSHSSFTLPFNIANCKSI